MKKEKTHQDATLDAAWEKYKTAAKVARAFDVKALAAAEAAEKAIAEADEARVAYVKARADNVISDKALAKAAAAYFEARAAKADAAGTAEEAPVNQ